MAMATGAADLAGRAEGVEVLGGMAPGFDGILTPEALGFVAGLHRSLASRVCGLDQWHQRLPGILEARLSRDVPSCERICPLPATD